MTDQFANFFNKNFRFALNSRTKTYGIFSNRSNKYVDTATVFNIYSQTMSDLGIAVGVTMTDVEKYISDNTPKTQEEQRLPITQFIEQWLKANAKNWQMSPAWKEIEYTYGGVTSPKDIDSLRGSLMVYIYENNLKYGVDEVKTALSVIAMNKQQEALKDMVVKMTYNEKMVEAGERWLRAIYDFFKPTSSYEKFAMMFKHWAWQVKRKIWNREVKNHIWINFMGGTGLGKTTALKKIMKVLDDFYSTTTVSKLFEDTKEFKRLTENYVLILDEIALNVESETGGVLSADQKAILKSMLSGDRLDARVYGTQQQSKRKITFSCISSANTHLYDVIFDDTSMRRFYEFDCKGEKPESYDTINKYLDNSHIFWQSIDENLEDGYWDVNSELGRQIASEQAAYYPTKTTTSMWVTAQQVTVGKEPATHAYKAYTAWCRDTGNRSKAYQNFLSDIKHVIPAAVDSSGRCHLDYKVGDEEQPWEAAKNLMNDPIQAIIGEL